MCQLLNIMKDLSILKMKSIINNVADELPTETWHKLAAMRLAGYRKKLILVFIYNLYLYISKKLTITEALKSTHCDIPWPPQTGHLPQITRKDMVSG